MTTIIYLIASFTVGFAIAWFVHTIRTKSIETKVSVANARLVDAEAALQRERDIREKELTNLKTTFQGISSEVLKESREEFLKQATPAISDHVRPLGDALKRYDEALRVIEGKREQAYGGLKGIIETLKDGQSALTRETGSLVAALKRPDARGKWGELTLRRVVEVAGMSKYCDFEEQASVTNEDGRLRPDMVVRLPGDRNVVVDAKVPIDAYMKAVESTDEKTRGENLAIHAKMIRDHMRKLGAKAYWNQFDPAPKFVVLFLPGESLFSAALETDRALIEDGLASNVILATPTTLIALLRSVEMGWQQQQLAENSIKISEAGRELYDRCSTFADHLNGVGANLERATSAFNKAIGSWESRIVPSTKRLKELGAAKESGQDIPSIEPIDTVPRQIAAGD